MTQLDAKIKQLVDRFMTLKHVSSAVAEEEIKKFVAELKQLEDVNSPLFNKVVAQLAHFVAGGWLVANSQLWWGRSWPGFLIVGGWVAFKEYYWDATKEKQTFWDNTFDALVYFAGALVQFILR